MAANEAELLTQFAQIRADNARGTSFEEGGTVDDWEPVDGGSTQDMQDEGPETTGAISQATPTQDDWEPVDQPGQSGQINDWTAINDWEEVTPEPEGKFGTLVRAAGHSVIPALGSLPAIGAGAKLGAMAGAPFGPIASGAGGIAGGLIGALGGGYLLSKAQDWIADQLGINDTAQRQANEEENPKSAFIGELAPNAAAFGMGAVPRMARFAGAGIMGGLEAGQEAANEGKFDPGKVAIAAGFGAGFAKPTALGERGLGLGERAVDLGSRFVPGRPNVPRTPAAAQAQQTATASPPQNTARGTAQVKPPPPGAQPSGGQAQTTAPNVGNPQSAVQGSPRTAAKETTPPAATSALTTGDMAPDQAAALQNVFGGPSPQAAAAAAQGPAATNLPDPHLVAASEQVQTQPPAPAPARRGKKAAPPPVEEEMVQPRSEADFGDAALGEDLTSPREGDVWKDGTNATAQDRLQNAPTSDLPVETGLEEASRGELHPDLPNVRVVRDRDVPYLAGSSNDARTVYVDPRVPDTIDVNGMTLDPALPLAVHEINERAGIEAIKQEIAKGKLPKMTDEQIYENAHEHAGNAAEKKYLEDTLGFTDKDWTRYQEIMKEISAKTEGEKPGTRNPPEDLYTFMYPKEEAKALHEEGSARPGTEAPAEAGAAPNVTAQEPVTATVKPVKRTRAVTKAIADARAAGMNMVAKAMEEATPKEAAQMARKTLEHIARPEGKIQTKDYAAPRVPSKPPVVEGLGVTARTKADAARKQGSIDTVKKAFDTYGPENDRVPVSKPDVAALKERLTKAVDEAGQAALDYKPRVRPKEWMWLREARKLVNGRMTQKQIANFIANEKQLRSGVAEDVENVRKSRRIESDIGMRKAPTVEEAEAGNAREAPVEEHAAEPKNEVDLTKLKPEELDKLADALVDPAVATVEEPAVPKWKVAEEERLAAEAQKSAKLREARAAREAAKANPAASPEKTLGTLVKKLAKDESAAGVIPSRDPVAAARMREPGYIAKSAGSPQEAYARTLSDRLHTVGQEDVSHGIGLQQKTKEMLRDAPDIAGKEKPKESIYLAREAGTTAALPADQKAFYDKYLEPVFKQNDQLYDNIEKIWPGLLGPKVKNHIYRISRGYTPETDMFNPGTAADPIQGVRNLPVGKKGTMHDRTFMALERDADGKRVVISPLEDGFTVWDKYKAIPIKSGLEVAEGKTIKIGGDTYTVRDALTPEIEKNGRFEDGKPARYYHDPVLSALLANRQLANTARHLQFMYDLKTDPEFLKYATRNYTEAAAKGWKETTLPQFDRAGDRWYFDDRLRMVLDDYAQPGFNTEGLNWLRRLSQGVTKMLFWMPTAHAANVGAHWFVERGWDWLTPRGYYSLVVDGLDAIKSVVTQDDFQKQLRNSGSGTIYGGILTQDLINNLARQMGVAIERNPAFWDPIARTLGVGPSDLARAVYKSSSKIMWAASDVFMTQAVKANLRKGMTMKEAIDTAERHIPNYRIPTTILSQAKFGRFMSQLMSDQAVAAFGRYHSGVFNSYAHIVKDLVSGQGPRQMEAVGNLVAMGILAFALKPVLDKMAAMVSGNEKAEVYPRGPLTFPTHITRALQGKEDVMTAARGAVTISPIASTAMETLANKDFTGRQIVEPGTVARAMKGNMPAAGRAALQEANHAAVGLVSPYGTFTNAAKAGKSVPQTVLEAALDIKNPSPKSMQFQAKLPMTNVQRDISRYKNPPSAAEKFYNKMFGF